MTKLKFSPIVKNKIECYQWLEKNMNTEMEKVSERGRGCEIERVECAFVCVLERDRECLCKRV